MSSQKAIANKKKVNSEQRSQHLYQILFACMALIVIASMIIAAISK